MSRFPKLTETFVLNEMVAVEREGARVDFYPLMRITGTRMHAEAADWLKRAHFEPFISWPILVANLYYLTRHPFQYWSTLLTLLRRTWGSVRFFVGGLVFFPKAVYFARRMMAADVDHVHAHFANHPAAVAWVIHRLTGIPYSFTAHGSDLHLERRMLREKAAAAAFVVTISEYNRRMILEECGPGASDKVIVIHCGVDTEVLRPRPAPQRTASEGKPLRILCVGALHEVKGQTYLIEACRRLNAKGIPFACDLIGDGPDRHRLAEQAHEGGIGGHVHFRGWRTREEVREALGEADVVAAPSVLARSGSREGIPVALMEAMASGIPVVASRLSGIPELVEDGETGLLIEPRDAEGIAQALERLRRDEQLRNRLGAAGREKVKREFNLRSSASTLVGQFMTGAKAFEPDALRRLDWRFLLANPRLDRVAYVGRRHGGPLRLLRQFCASLEVLGADAYAEAAYSLDSAHDVVVAFEPSHAELQLAARSVRPGGALVVEGRGAVRALWDRRSSPNSWFPDQLTRAVSELGFEDVLSSWHWPSFDRCTQIIPLDEPLAARCAFARSGGGLRQRVRARAGQVLLGTGLLRWVVESMSVVATRASARTVATPSLPHGRERDPRPHAWGRSVIHTILDQHWDRLGLERYFGFRNVSFVVLTPGFRNSRHLVFLLLAQGKTDPVLVAKLPRRPGACESTEREAQVLREIQARRPGGFESIPRLVALETFEDRRVLIETAIPGRALDRATVRRDPRSACEATLTWLTEVQSATRNSPDSAGAWFERHIGRQLSALETTFPAEGGLVGTTRELCLPLFAGIPLVLEHGDLGHPNLLLNPAGRVAAIDWELAETEGLPATDLFFFLAYVARAQSRAHSGIQSVAALDRAFFEPRGWARNYVLRYAEAMALPLETLTPLFIACWARQVAGLVRRTAEERENAPSAKAGSADWIRQDWRFAIWRHAVARANRLCWNDLRR